MRQRTWSEPLQSHRDADAQSVEPADRHQRRTRRPLAVSALALIAAALIVAVLAAAL